MEPSSPKRLKMSNGEAEESSYIPTAEDGGGKVSILFSLKQEAGALQKALSAFNVRTLGLGASVWRQEHKRLVLKGFFCYFRAM